MAFGARPLIFAPKAFRFRRAGTAAGKSMRMQRFKTALLLCVAVLVALATVPAKAHGPDEILPRRVIFGNPERSAPLISPDGSQIVFTAPVDGVLNVWVGPTNDVSAARPITQEKQRPILKYWWANNGTH